LAFAFTAAAPFRYGVSARLGEFSDLRGSVDADLAARRHP
jgi:hypothetical protein